MIFLITEKNELGIIFNGTFHGSRAFLKAKKKGAIGFFSTKLKTWPLNNFFVIKTRNPWKPWNSRLKG